MWDEKSTQDANGVPVAPGKLRVTIYKRGAVVTGWSYDGPTGGGKRKPCRGLTDKSRYRLSWKLDNARVDWGATTLLTFQRQPKDPKRSLERFVRLVRGDCPDLPYAWWMETQKRGVTHFHFLWGAEWLDARGWRDDEYQRLRGPYNPPRFYLRGPLDDICASAWVASLHRPTLAEKRFTHSGCTELVRDSTKVAWYPASEAGKREQKLLPPGSEGLGRWWYISPEAQPEARGGGHLADYPFPRPMSLIFDASALDVRPGLPEEDPDGIPY